MKRIKLLGIFLAIIVTMQQTSMGIIDDAWAVPSSLSMTTQLKNSGRSLTVKLTPTSSPVGCTLSFRGSTTASSLKRATPRGTLLFSSSIETSIVDLSALSLKRIKKPRGSRVSSQRFYFLSTLSCSDGSVKSNITNVRISYGTSGAKNSSQWLSQLKNKIILGSLQIQKVFSSISFDAPLDLQNPKDGTDRLFVVEQGGIIKVIDGANAVTASTFLDISSKLISGGEQGLLGLAFHPNYGSNGYFFVNYSEKESGATIVARYKVKDGSPNEADLNSELRIIKIDQPYANHNGGGLAFGSDGYLYIGMGDGGSGGDPLGNGQNTGALLGKMLRIDVDHTANDKNYAIPADNPFVGNAQGIKEEIYAGGFRNPFRFSFDPTTERLWAGDVGQGEVEEIDVVEKGKNYGWNKMEGSQCYPLNSSCNPAGLELPVAEYHHEGSASVTGGYVYRGSALLTLVGSYFYADFINGKIWKLEYNGQTGKTLEIFDTDKNISSFGVDKDGELYFLSYGEGAIYKFVP